MEQKETFESFVIKGNGFSVTLYSGKEAFKHFDDYAGDAKLFGKRADGSLKLLKMKCGC